MATERQAAVATSMTESATHTRIAIPLANCKLSRIPSAVVDLSTREPGVAQTNVIVGS